MDGGVEEECIEVLEEFSFQFMRVNGQIGKSKLYFKHDLISIQGQGKIGAYGSVILDIRILFSPFNYHQLSSCDNDVTAA